MPERTKPLPIYISGDTHFGHDKLIKWGRPADFTRIELESFLKIPHEAYLLHLGDFCIGKDDYWHSAFMAHAGHIEHRVLIRGNHDNKSNTWYLQHGWHAVFDIAELDVHGQRLVFSHIPVDPADYDWAYANVHAHTHGNSHRDEELSGILEESYHIEYAPELFNYQPLLLTDKVIQAVKRNAGN